MKYIAAEDDVHFIAWQGPDGPINLTEYEHQVAARKLNHYEEVVDKLIRAEAEVRSLASLVKAIHPALGKWMKEQGTA